MWRERKCRCWIGSVCRFIQPRTCRMLVDDQRYASNATYKWNHDTNNSHRRDFVPDLPKMLVGGWQQIASTKRLLDFCQIFQEAMVGLTVRNKTYPCGELVAVHLKNGCKRSKVSNQRDIHWIGFHGKILTGNP